MEWIIALIPPLILVAAQVFKELFGTNVPQRTVIEHVVPDIEVARVEDDASRLRDLGL